MSMTTMLTLSSMFSSLTTITPPISYTTKLDIWMVSCIAFVFGTLFEFTVVIFLKYYLKHLPAIHMDSVFSPSLGSSSRPKTVTNVKSQIQAWMQVVVVKALVAPATVVNESFSQKKIGFRCLTFLWQWNDFYTCLFCVL